MMGTLNVNFGTDLHRWFLKSEALKKELQAGAPELRHAAKKALAAQFPNGSEGQVPDFIAVMRSITLHAVVVHLLGEEVLKAYNASGGDLVKDYMRFQDHVEDATAK
eukprot:3140363-Amphidinium_carterae.1